MQLVALVSPPLRGGDPHHVVGPTTPLGVDPTPRVGVYTLKIMLTPCKDFTDLKTPVKNCVSEG